MNHPLWQPALTAFHQGEFDEAAGLFQQICEAEPDSPTAWKALAHARTREGDYEAALPAAQRWAHLAPDNAGAHYRVAWLLYHFHDRPREAGEALGRAVGLSPGLAKAHYLLGLVHLALDDASSAHHRLHILRTLDSQLASDLQRAIAPHRQQTVVLSTIVVLSLWLSAGKWFVPRRYSELWLLAGLGLFSVAFVMYRTYQKQAHPEGLPRRRFGEGEDGR